MSKPLWIVLLIITGALALWWGSFAGIDLWRYASFSTEVPARVEGWDVVPKGSKYAIKASYRYEYQRHEFNGETVFAKPYHLNRAAALADIEQVRGMRWTAWVNPRAPERSSLQKNFPIKKTFYAAILLGIFLYFCCLYAYLQFSTRE